MSHTQKFNVGDKIRYVFRPDSETHTVVVAEPDSRGFIVIVTSGGGRYFVVDPQDYELAPKRYVVEVRVPKAGDRFVSGGAVFIEHGGTTSRGRRPVIVEEL